jgi:hypothetical protein
MPQLVMKALHVCYFFDPFSGSKLVQRYDALSQKNIIAVVRSSPR